jgi:type IV pilus assembly protein PilM
MMKRPKFGIGLDVGSRTVQLAVLRVKKGEVSVEKAASREISHDAVVEGSVMDSQMVCEKISELLNECRPYGKDVAISVGGRRVMIKKIATDEMSDDELNAAIAYEARSNLPFDTSEVSLDYARLPQDFDSGRMEVLLVAARNEIVFDAAETLRWAGGKPMLLEAEPFALQAALLEAGYIDEQNAAAALHIGFQSTDVTLFDRGQFAGNRNLNVGGKTYVEGLIRELGIPFERASSLLGRGQHSEEEDRALAHIAERVADHLADQVARAFPEHFTSNTETPLSRVVLCGGGALLPYLEPELARRFDVEVLVASPFRSFTPNTKTVKPSALDGAAEYTAAVGLALRAFGEPHTGFNLLPAGDRPSDTQPLQIKGLGMVVPIVGGALILLAMLFSFVMQQVKIAGLNQRLETVRRETDQYRDKINLVEELGRKRSDITARIGVISGLDKNRFTRVRLMQTLNNALPELTWLTDVQEVSTPRGAGVNVSGVTSSNLKVSQFMTNLLASKSVRGVDLLVSEQTEIAGTAVTRFTLQAAIPDINLVAPPPPKSTDKIKQGEKAVRDAKGASQKANQQ